LGRCRRRWLQDGCLRRAEQLAQGTAERSDIPLRVERQEGADRLQQSDRLGRGDIVHKSLHLGTGQWEEPQHRLSGLVYPRTMFRVTSCIVPHAPLEGLAAWITVEQNGGAPVNVTVYSTESGALSVPGWTLSPAWRTALTAAINRANTRPDTLFHRETEHDFTRRAAAWRRNQEVQRRQEVERQTILRQEAEREAVQRSKRKQPAAASNVSTSEGEQAQPV